MTEAPIYIYNTMTHQKEEFIPLHPGKVNMYVCGPTTYNYIHLGNARPIVVFDTVRRYFAYRGYDVNYVSNFTDVDDKIIRKANEEGKTAKEVAEFYIDAFFEDVERLNVMPANVHPKVSDNIEEIIQFIQELINTGHAYPLDNGDVYYSVRSYADYGKLSGRDVDDMKSGARIEVDEQKHDPLDFALWKNAKPGEPSWSSPWGEGRPGWHIECSAMSRKYFGPEFDIHGGGQDLIFPHHENEIAQSCALHEGDMAKYWMHNGFITIDKEKMSKSKGNFFLLREILEKHDPQTVRYYLLSVHYRSPLDFDDEKIDMAKRSLERIKNCYYALANAAKNQAGDTVDSRAELEALIKDTRTRYEEAMNDDFNTAVAISSIFDFVREANKQLKDKINKEQALEMCHLLEDLLGVLGLEIKGNGQENAGILEGLMKLLIELRASARQEKNFAQADKIRDDLTALGVVLEDGKDGTTWKIKE